MADIQNEIKTIEEAARGEEVRDAIIEIFRRLEGDIGGLTDSSATKKELEQGLGKKQDNLTFDDAPKEGSGNPVTSAGIKKAIDEAKPNIVYDDTPTAGSGNPVTSDGIRKAIDTFKPSVYVEFDYDSENDRLTQTNSADMVTDFFRVIQRLLKEHTLLDVLYRETDRALKNEADIKLYLSDFNSGRFTFASNPYDGVRLQIIVREDSTMERIAENIRMEVVE